MKETIQELAARDVRIWNPKLDPDSAEGKEEINGWISEMLHLLSEVELGKVYVYFDGYAIPADADGMIISGIHKKHDLKFVPQVRGLKDPSAKAMLDDPDYWMKDANDT